MESVKLALRSRDGRGTKAAKAVRAEGDVPGVLYGRGNDPVAFRVDARELRHAVSGQSGTHAILDISLEGGKPRTAMIKELQRDPVRDRVVHLDLHEISLREKIQSVVPVQLTGHAHGV